MEKYSFIIMFCFSVWHLVSSFGHLKIGYESLKVLFIESLILHQNTLSRVGKARQDVKCQDSECSICTMNKESVNGDVKWCGGSYNGVWEEDWHFPARQKLSLFKCSGLVNEVPRFANKTESIPTLKMFKVFFICLVHWFRNIFIQVNTICKSLHHSKT